jgi:3-hydroxymyristoyl/3-hydroxydecanoyl-(acyl carrier protein) dehydratase
MSTSTDFGLVTDAELYERIEVCPPYFALSDVRRESADVVTARIRPSQSLGEEVGPISAAETGRHLAILGSCAAAFVNPVVSRHFYLAYDAELRRSRTRIEPEYDGELFLRARSHFVDSSTAVALADLRTEDDRTVYTLVVFYLVVPEADFRALFADNERPDAPLAGRPDPYHDVIGLGDISIWDTRMHASLGEIDPYRCAGHFPGLPAMPVAFLMSNIGHATGQLLSHVLSRDTTGFVVREASIRAENLAFAGEKVDLHVEYQRFASGTHWFHCAAIADGSKPVGKAHVKLRVRD